MSDDAKREGLIAFCEQGKDCEPATPWEEGYMAAMRVVVQHIKSAAPASAQTPAGEALREAIEWAETVLCALQPTEQVRMRVLIAAALASQSSARPQTWPVDADGHAPNLCNVCGAPVRYGERHSQCGAAVMAAEATWLIERGQREGQSPTLWWCLPGKGDFKYGGRWSEDANKAYRFASKAAAEHPYDIGGLNPRHDDAPTNIHGDLDHLCHASEHVFIDIQVTDEDDSAALARPESATESAPPAGEEADEVIVERMREIWRKTRGGPLPGWTLIAMILAYGEGRDAALASPAVEAQGAWKKAPLGCGQQFFGAFGGNYEDGVCIDGYLWDLDSCDEPGGGLSIGGDRPCPTCNAEEALTEQIEELKESLEIAQNDLAEARAAIASQSSARPQEGAAADDETRYNFCRHGELFSHCYEGPVRSVILTEAMARTLRTALSQPSPAAKVADALAELVACLAEQAAIPYGRTPDEAERAFNRRRANERRTERALTGGREALAAYLARPSCTYPACRCEGPGPDGGCGSAAIPSPDGAAG